MAASCLQAQALYHTTLNSNNTTRGTAQIRTARPQSRLLLPGVASAIVCAKFNGFSRCTTPSRCVRGGFAVQAAQASSKPSKKPSKHAKSANPSKSKPTISPKPETLKPAKSDLHISYTQLNVDTKDGISLHDITPQIVSILEESGIRNGFVNVLSRHTTTSICINENEARLTDDVRQYLLKLAPPDHPYLHNDLHLRSGPKDWPGGDAAWRAQEPVNAHSHLLSMLLGNSETVPVAGGALTLGTWQSVMLLELDGPRARTIGVQIVGQ